MTSLLRAGFAYAGQLHGRPSVSNEIIDDVFVNFTHLATHFPNSRALQDAPAGWREHAAAAAPPHLRRGHRAEF